MTNRRKFTLDEKRIVYAKCNGKCAICGQSVKFKKMTVDHKVPLSKGGTNAMENLQLACHSCNLLKSDLSMDELTEKMCRVMWNFQKNRIKNIFAKEV